MYLCQRSGKPLFKPTLTVPVVYKPKHDIHTYAAVVISKFGFNCYTGRPVSVLYSSKHKHGNVAYGVCIQV